MWTFIVLLFIFLSFEVTEAEYYTTVANFWRMGLCSLNKTLSKGPVCKISKEELLTGSGKQVTRAVAPQFKATAYANSESTANQ